MSPKQRAAEGAAALVESGMRVGLGTGSTAAFFVARLGERVAAGLDVVGVPTSEATRRQAESLGIRLTTLDDTPELDLTVDGADEIDDGLRLIKGAGGALLREKLVAVSSRRMVVIADETKRVGTLGRNPLPVEIVPFAMTATLRRLAAVVGTGTMIAVRRQQDGSPFVTDSGHFIADLHLGAIADAEDLGRKLKAVIGVVEHGLFIGLASQALIGSQSGVIEIVRP